jgi:hypothetical protein
MYFEGLENFESLDSFELANVRFQVKSSDLIKFQ